MYELQEIQFGAYKKLQFFNKKSGNGFSIVPEIGGTVLEIWLNNTLILEGCESSEELNNNQSYRSSFLFPFPNRLKDGNYEYDGKKRQFPINDLATNNAIHGLSRDVEMDVLSTNTFEDSASISLSYFAEGTNKAYPYPFLFDVLINISEEKGFEVNMKCTNESDVRIPIGIGWHPYFKIGSSINDLNFEMPDCKMIELDDRMIPTGVTLSYDYFKKLRRLSNAVLDNGFKLKAEAGKEHILLSNSEITLDYWQETGPQKFNFLQIYTPPSRSCIAIEPMTCNIDAFNTGDGLILLSPENFIEASCGINVFRDEA